MTIKTGLIIGLLLLLIGAAIGRYTASPTETVKEVEKEVVKHDVVTVTHEVKRPDGTTETEITTTDKTKESSTKKTEVSSAAAPNWFLVGSATKDNVYGLQVNRRILGPAFVGVGATTDHIYTLNVGVEF